MVTKDQSIAIITKNTERLPVGYRSVTFERPRGFIFQSGDWIDIEQKGFSLSGGKTYSIASSPTEVDITIVFREGQSERKRLLQNLAPGDTLCITQYGNDYGFQLKPTQSSVLIAGGVGIAPFRSMLKEMYDTGATNHVSLIYLNQTDTFLFSEELDFWAGQLPNVTITYIPTKDMNRKKREKLIRSLITSVNQNFYLSGPPGMVDSNEHLLLDMGVSVTDIRIDVFGGY